MRLALSWGIQASHEMPLPIYPVSFETPVTASLSGLFCTTKADLLADYGHITALDLVNAWAYAASHAEEIAAAIQLNNEVA